MDMNESDQFILALDQGTTSSRAMLFDKKGKVVAKAQRDFPQYFPKPGWVEHDPMEIWTSQASVATEVVAGANIAADQIAGIGITNQRETTILWDRQTGEPLHNAIVWQDRRTAAFCESLIDEGVEKMVREKTGLRIDAYFSATKIKWLLDNVPHAREKALEGQVCFGTVDAWLIWKLSNGKKHLTDITNASRTMLYNIHDLDWDNELLQLFDIPREILPEVKSSSEVFCTTSGKIFSAKIPIAGIAGDQQAALFGQLCLENGMVKTTYGTGCFMVMNTGNSPVLSDNRLLTTIAWKINGNVTYALEGSVFIGGAGIQWLRDSMHMLKSAEESETMANSLPDNEGVYFVPALTGLGAPHWDQDARGAFFGITRGTKPAHFARAALEAIAYQVYDVLHAMEKDTGTAIELMKVDGGAAANDFLMQFQTDLLHCKVQRPKMLETTALGAAYLAGLAVGYWKDENALKALWEEDEAFSPEMDSKQVNDNLSVWHKAVERSKNWLSS